MRIATLAVVTVAGLVGWAAPSMAQAHDGDCPDHMAHMSDQMTHMPDHMAQMKEALNLTEEQATQIEAIVGEAKARHDAMHDSSDQAAAHEQMKAHHEETIARIDEVLNEEQRDKLAEMHEAMMGRHEGGHCGSRHD